MANLETQYLDEVILTSRRKMLALGGTALVGLVTGCSDNGTITVAPKGSYSDADILNFALNLEYLEANFYYLAAFGTTIGVSNAASLAAGAPVLSTTGGGVGTAGTVNSTGAAKVPFTSITTSSYAIETAVEEGKHVAALQAALGTVAVAQPAINLAATGTGAVWPALATAAGVAGGATFNPYSSDANFLLGAYVFEDVGVTAYHGAASLLTVSGNLSVAAGILGVEAYHAGLIRTTLNALDPTGALGLVAASTAISSFRAGAALAAAPASTYDPNPDDFGLATFAVTLGGVTGYTGTRIVDAACDAVNTFAIASSRNTAQVLNIVTGGGKVTNGVVNAIATGGFFTAGLNSGPYGFR